MKKLKNNNNPLAIAIVWFVAAVLSIVTAVLWVSNTDSFLGIVWFVIGGITLVLGVFFLIKYFHLRRELQEEEENTIYYSDLKGTEDNKETKE